MIGFSSWSDLTISNWILGQMLFVLPFEMRLFPLSWRLCQPWTRNMKNMNQDVTFSELCSNGKQVQFSLWFYSEKKKKWRKKTHTHNWNLNHFPDQHICHLVENLEDILRWVRCTAVTNDCGLISISVSCFQIRNSLARHSLRRGQVNMVVVGLSTSSCNVSLFLVEFEKKLEIWTGHKGQGASLPPHTTAAWRCQRGGVAHQWDGWGGAGRSK